MLYVFFYSALSDNEPVYAQVDRHHKTRTPERSQRTHRRHMSACVQVPPVESTDGTDIPVHQQLVNDLTTGTDSLNLNAIRRKYRKNSQWLLQYIHYIGALATIYDLPTYSKSIGLQYASFLKKKFFLTK